MGGDTKILKRGSKLGQGTMVPNTRLKIVIFYSSFIEKMQTMYSIKVGLSPSIKNGFICFNERPLKTIKDVFYFILRAIFILKIFIFLS